MNAELIARLEAAEVGSRELDINLALETEHPYGFDTPEDEENCPRYTTSLDSALALALRVLPRETMWNISHMAVIGGKDFYFCELCLPETGPEIDTSGEGWSPSLAACAAILRALDAQE